MRHLYKYIMAALFALVVDMATAQEVVSDELIRDRVTSYTPTSDNDVNNLTSVNYIGHKVEESVRWTNDIRIGYGAPGVFSLLMLDESFIIDYDDMYIPEQTLTDFCGMQKEKSTKRQAESIMCENFKWHFQQAIMNLKA